MQKKYFFSKKWFTLVELLVVIALIMIILLWMNSWNFNKLSNEQRAEKFANRIISEIEELRDNMISWKGFLDWSKISFDSIVVFTIDNQNIKKIYRESNKTIILKKDEKEKIVWQYIKNNNKFIKKDSITLDFNHKNSIITIDNREINKALKIKVWYNNECYDIDVDRISWLIKKAKSNCDTPNEITE